MMNKNITALFAAGLAVVSAATMAAPVMAQEGRQKDKNNMRNLGIGLGAGALYELSKGKKTNALILGAGAAYSTKKYEDARKAQSKESSRRVGNREYRYRNGKRVGYYKLKSGKRNGYVAY